ncbi:acyl-CoA dehydrogenase [Jatrophihabitans sp.]|uniref:acyl-CoA dehydrogenase n=1 Tax=Jatrophihabitans sp. TaxID=1932789 RepID=UPI0032C2111B
MCVKTSEDLPDWSTEFCSAVDAARDDVAAGLELARTFGRSFPAPGSGATAVRWRLLALAGSIDLTAARILEAHTDALAILAEAGEPPPDGTWGVFAAEMPNVHLDATGADDATTLTGTKPWCSLGGVLDHALVTAHTPDGRRLFAVDLHQPSVTADDPARWVARGLAHVTSAPVTFDATPARPVGAAGWYLERDGFAWGGLGVAACWYGGALGLYRTLAAALDRKDGDLARLHVGTVDAALHGAAATLAQAAAAVDRGEARGPAGELLALRVRAVVADAVERTLRQVGHALGPAPLAFDDEHARRVADLELYVRQHHAERDLAALGTARRGAEVTAR